MKILYITHRFYPERRTAAETVVLSLAKMMQQCGHRVKVFTYSFNKPGFYDCYLGPIAIKEFIYEGIPVLAFRHRDIPQDLDSGFQDPGLAEIAGDLLRREVPDLIHAAHSSNVGELLKAATQLAVPYILTVTDFFMVCPKSVLRPDGSVCGGPESGAACFEHCPELPMEAIQQRRALTRELLINAKTVTASSLLLGQILQREFGELTIKILEGSGTVNPVDKDLSTPLLPTVEQVAYRYERIYNDACHC
jgi:hypothetical protein